MKFAFFWSLFFLTIWNVGLTQNSIIICQKCKQRAVNIANVEIISNQKINEDCEKFVVHAPKEPIKTALLTDTVGYDIFPFWIEKEQLEIKFTISECREKEIWIENPSMLNHLERATFHYVKYLESFCKGNENSCYDNLYKDYLKANIVKNSNNFFALHCLNILMNIDAADTVKKYFETLSDSSVKTYALYNNIRRQMGNLTLKRYPKTNDVISFFDVSNREGVLYTPSKKVKLFFLWTTNCGPCKKVIPRIIELSKQYAAFEFKFIALDENAENWQKQSKRFFIPEEMNLIDSTGTNGKFFLNTSPFAFPTYLLLDKENKLLVKTEGADDIKLIEIALRKLSEF